ncbi:M56 family metallopeptidase [Mycolicibacterium mucogenicum]|uniref:Peptidase M48 domain-containing protein n=2 Tax=Mycolicibacterium TaxID=1866885 RepID=A0ABM7IMS2_9MYCO|nr:MULTISPECIES: M56 family metallopeptidase [Mycolicibacterium]MCX8557094.1 M56 family metallopeptidase [Mycolicibacterium mucogenicum]MCX8564721.1 M56 family metallopeptidase [Mycolicibacterium mucogenicum]RUP29164.1 MAG: M56 family peptidase [Mycolicibacterium sp.]TLH62735.1 peptidase M48 [Mycolicibacterium aubagnense]BBX88116.1 hypothetical protein MAUB_63170 [Mycolicibacterium aubagnense]
MNAAGLLVAHGIVLGVAGPPVLARLTHGGHAPRSGIAAWLVAIVAFLVSWLAVGVLVAGDVLRHWHQTRSLVASCVELLCDLAAGRAGGIAQVTVLAAVAAAAAGVVFSGARLTRTIVRLRAKAHRHSEAIRLVGQPTADADVYVMQTPERAAYCVSGRPATIVVTSAAVAALGERELAAVIAHERAHVAGRHLAIVTAMRGVALILPRVRLITRGATEVARLLEMCADDAAAARYGRRALLDGLMALVGAAPASALGAADVAVLHRAERLACPATQRVRIGTQAALGSASTLIAVGPLAVAALCASGVWMCAL